MATNIQIKRGNAASWTQQNPVLAEGELGLELDTRKMKAGDGVTPWNSLSYSASPNLADYTEDATHRTVTDNEKALWNAKEDIAKTLVEVTDPAASLQAGKRYHVTVDDGDTFTMSFDAATLAKTDSQAEIAVYIELGEGATVAGGSNVAIEDEVAESGWYRLVATNDNGTVSAKLYSSSAGGDELVIEIPGSTSAYSLADNSRYTHTPLSQPTYTLPEVTNGKIAHKIVIDIDFTHTQYAEFVSNGTNPVAIDSVSPSEGEVYRMTCRYIAGNWRIGAEKILSTNTIESNTGEIEIEDAVAGKAKALSMTAPQSVVMNQLAKATDVTTNTSSNGVVEVSDAVAGDALALKMTAPRSVVVNQLGRALNNTNWIARSASYGTITFESNNVVTVTVNDITQDVGIGGNSSSNKVPITNGHTYLMSVECKAPAGFILTVSYPYTGAGITWRQAVSLNNTWERLNYKATAGVSTSQFMTLTNYVGSEQISNPTYSICNFMIVDLTQYFNGDHTLIDSITSWDDLVAYDPRFASYVEYNTGTVTGVQPQVRVTGKNLFDKTQTLTNGFYNDQNLFTSSNNWRTTYLIPVKAGSTITGTYLSYGGDGPSLRMFDADQNYIGLIKHAIIDATHKTYVLDARCCFVQDCFKVEDLNTYQLELGSVATAYEPYHDGGTAQAPAPLFAVGTAADEFEAVSGVTTHKMGSYTFTGEELVRIDDWSHIDGYYACVFSGSLTPDFNYNGASSGHINWICGFLSVETIANIVNGTIGVGMGNNTNYSIYIRVPNSLASNLTTLKAWLTGKTVYYELAEPTTSQSTPAQISIQSGNNTAMQTDGGRTLEELAITCTAGLYNRAIDPTHVYIHYNGVASEIVAGESSIVINGSTDELVDLTQYFGGDSALIASIANWGDLVAYDSTFASAVAYNKGTVAGIAPSVKVNDGSAITSPSELFRINAAKNTYDAINGSIVEEAGRVNLATLAWTESDGSYSATVSDIKASTANILLPNGYTGSVSGTTLTITASESPTGYMVYEKATATTTDVTPVEVILQQDENSIVQVDGGRKADPVKVTYECQPSSFDVVTKEDLVPAYVYGIDTDMSNLECNVAAKQVLLNNAYDNDEYPSELKYVEQANGFGVLPVHQIRRLVSDDLANRHVNYWLHHENSNFKEDGVTPSVLTGEDGDVMAELPVSYMRVDHYTDSDNHPHNVTLLSARKFRGSRPYTLFRVGKGGKSVRPYWTGAFRSVHCDSTGTPKTHTASTPATWSTGDKFRSIAGSQPAGSITRANFLQGHQNNGGTSVHFLFGSWLKILMAVEYGSWNEQAKFSVGFTNTNSFLYANMRKTGRTAIYGNGSGEIEADDLTLSGEDYDITVSASGGASNWNTTAKNTHSQRIVQCSYRGIEDPFGSQYTMDDGIQKNQNAIILSITISGTTYLRDSGLDTNLPLYCFKNGSTSCYAKSATPAVNDTLYSNTTGTSKGTITAVDSENGTVTCGGVVYTRTSASDTNGKAYGWRSSSNMSAIVYTWISNPTGGTAYSDTGLDTSAGSIASFEADYTISGYWMTTDTDKFTQTHTSKNPPSDGKGSFPFDGCSDLVWVHHDFPKASGYISAYDPWTLIRLPSIWSGSSTKGLADYYYNDAAAGARLLLRGGNSAHTAIAGLAYGYWYSGLTYGHGYFGSRPAA